jgi:hypothetical protein
VKNEALTPALRAPDDAVVVGGGVTARMAADADGGTSLTAVETGAVVPLSVMRRVAAVGGKVSRSLV